MATLKLIIERIQNGFTITTNPQTSKEETVYYENFEELKKDANNHLTNFLEQFNTDITESEE